MQGQLTRKYSMQQVLFHFSRIAGSIKIFSQYKKLPAIKKELLDKFVKQKRTFCKICHGMQFFFELQCLIDDLVYFFKLSIFTSVSSS